MTPEPSDALTGEVLPAVGAAVPAIHAPRPAGVDVDELVRAWLIEYRSPHTRDAYRLDLDEWLSFCDTSGLAPVADPTRTHVAAWLRLREELRESSSTRARRLAAVSAWYRWLLATGHRDPEAGNPAAALDARNKPKMQPLASAAALTREEAERLLAAADADTGGAGLRTPAIVALLLYCGLRVSELVNADLDQLGYDRGHRVLRFVIKGGHPHVVPLPASVLRRLDPYLASRPDLTADRLPTQVAGVRPARPLFATATGGRLDRGAVWRLLRRLATKAGIKVTMSPHVLRATCATLSRDAGAALDQVQELLGHSDPRTTAGYDRRAGRLDHSPALALQRFLHDPADAAPAERTIPPII